MYYLKQFPEKAHQEEYLNQMLVEFGHRFISNNFTGKSHTARHKHTVNKNKSTPGLNEDLLSFSYKKLYPVLFNIILLSSTLFHSIPRVVNVSGITIYKFLTNGMITGKSGNVRRAQLENQP